MHCVASPLRLRECRSKRIAQRRPEEQQVRSRSVVFDRMHRYLSLEAAFQKILSNSGQRDSTEDMDSTEDPRHQAPAHVCAGQYARINLQVSPNWPRRFSLISPCRCLQKWLPSTQQSPYAATPGLRSGKANIRPHQEVRDGDHVHFIMCLQSFYTNLFLEVSHKTKRQNNLFVRVQLQAEEKDSS